MDSEQLERIRDVKGDSGSREVTGREIEPWEIAALMRVCAADKTPAGARDAALFAVAYKTGARREELASITLANITRTNDGAEIRVIGKRNKQRTLFIDNGAMQALDDWLKVRGDSTGALFCAISQIGMIELQHHISTTALHNILAKRADEAELSNLTWHDFRRTFASTLLDAGADIAIVAGMMGHASVNTTARYDRRPQEAKRKAARKISVPYFGRKG
jgi:site-specific recombinase XerD